MARKSNPSKLAVAAGVVGAAALGYFSYQAMKPESKPKPVWTFFVVPLQVDGVTLRWQPYIQNPKTDEVIPLPNQPSQGVAIEMAKREIRKRGGRPKQVSKEA